MKRNKSSINEWDEKDEFVYEIGTSPSLKEFSSYLNYILLFIFLIVCIFTAIRFKDPMLMILGAIVFATGLSAAQGLDEFGASIQRAKGLVTKYDTKKHTKKTS